MSRSPCKRMIRRVARQLSRERDNYVADFNVCKEGDEIMDENGNFYPIGGYYVTEEDKQWPN